MMRAFREKTQKLGRHPRQLALFSSVGALNTVLDFAVYSGAIVVGVTPALANILGFAVANPFSYLVNARVTFRNHGKPAATSFQSYGKFLAAHLVSLVVSTFAVHFLAVHLGPFAAKLSVIALTLAANYSFSALFVFPNQDTKD